MIKERLKEFLKYIGISTRQFELNCSLGMNTIGNNPKGAIRSDKLEKILNYYPELNALWLLTGRGKMVGEPLVYDDEVFIKERKASEHTTIQINGDVYNSVQNVVNFVHAGQISPSAYCTNVLADHIATHRSTFNRRLQDKKDWRAV